MIQNDRSLIRMKLLAIGELTAMVSLFTIEGALEQGINVSSSHLMSTLLQLYQHSRV